MKVHWTPQWIWVAQCALGGLGLISTTFVCFRLGFDVAAAGFAYVILIALISVLGSLSASIVLSIASAACLNYFFAQPLFEFRIDSPQDVIAVAAFTTTSLIVTALTTAVRKSAKAAEASQQALIDTIPASVWIALPDGSREFYKRSWQELSAADSPGNEVAMFHPDDREYVVEKWRSAVATGEEFEVEARVRTATGEYRAMLVRAAPLRDEKGHVVKWYGVSTDIEDLRRAVEALRESEQTLRSAQAELAHANRVATMGQLTASIAHEVNQPLAGVVANAEACLRWLDRETPNLDAARRSVECIINDGNRASEVIRRVRALATKTETKQEPLDINRAISEVVPLVKRELINHKVSLRTELESALPAVLADRVQLHQVIINLVMNSIEAMQSVTDRPRELVIGSHQDETHRVLVTVTDSGVGISAENADRLFNAFFTTKSSGMGMGLSICRSIVEAHGGRMSGANNVGPGATFQCVLPVQRQAAS
ncbi:ATP-binding protein [Bradyrhizobium erythrophlei]|uniref:histidine kinase n=1 Tax=Bradyrhizobium erythrophlei TaxID=1437360 RepID=A0A1M5S0R1_9BRAD|nr:ATP-binding protein [Bradyrhizobium erythrophlei]SHH32015.1 PAS domain S-box-containing protein [Bradyrhizobium erythrophlei]